MSDLPEPLTPKDCDLRNMDWFPLQHKRMRRSSFWLHASDTVKALSVELWCESFEQVPAGSLPDDDVALADVCGFGRRNIEEWHAVKDHVMAAWTLCSDGRWYHPTVCEVAMEVFIRKLQDRARKKNDAGKRARGRLAELGHESADADDKSADKLKQSTEKQSSSDVTGQDRTKKKKQKKDHRPRITPTGARSAIRFWLCGEPWSYLEDPPPDSPEWPYPEALRYELQAAALALRRNPPLADIPSTRREYIYNPSRVEALQAVHSQGVH